MARVALLFSVFYLFAAALCLGSCSSSQWVAQVRARDWAAVDRSVRQAEAQGQWTAQDTYDLALEVLQGEIKVAGRPAANSWIPGLRGCARAILPALKARARQDDAVAAGVTRILIENDAVSFEALVTEHHDAKDPLWRAVAMRAAIMREYGALRLQGIRDPDSTVRRAALVATRIAADQAGQLPVEELLQVARRDPEPINRSLAARAATSLGSAKAVLFLRDYWAEVATEERVTFVEAWAQPKALAAGGERELEWVMGTQGGTPAVVAALALQHTAQSARALLQRVLGEGALQQQGLAAQMISLEHAGNIAALKRALENPGTDNDLKVTIWKRLAGLPQERKGAIVGLKKLASRFGAAGQNARHALAHLGDASVKNALLGELAFGTASVRLKAAAGLIALGQEQKVAPLLADRSVDTRVKASCLVLASKSTAGD